MVDKTHLYRLIIGQLKADGHHSIGSALERECNVIVPDSTADRDALSHLLQPKKFTARPKRLRHDYDGSDSISSSSSSSTSSSATGDGEDWTAETTDDQPASVADVDDDEDIGDHLEFNDRGMSLREGPGDSKSGLETKFITTHKKIVRCARFSPNGAWVATGSEDTSIKVLDVEKMKTYQDIRSTSSGIDHEPPATLSTAATGPVARPFYDHRGPVTDLEFHPYAPVLFSASKDCSIRMYDVSPSATASKRSFKAVQDTHPVRSISVHPAGDHLLVATTHPIIRLYDITTLQPFVGTAWAEESHARALNQIRYSPNGRQFVSAGKDGDIRVWDSTNNRCVMHIANAHKQYEVSCASFARNNFYILSGGKDSSIRLWDIRMKKQIKSYLGSNQSKNRVTTTFTYNEDYILSSDETNSNLLVWNSHTCELIDKLSGHNSAICWVAASPTEFVALSCSLDSRARFWAPSDTP